MKSLMVIVVLLTAAVVNADNCPGFDPVAACERCLQQRNYNQYTVCPSDRNLFYHCEITRGDITAHEQRCPKCLWFSKDTWGCTDQDTDPSCVPEHQPLFTENIQRFDDCCFREAEGPEGYYKQFYKVVTDPSVTAPYSPLLYYYWVVNGWPYLMPCPDGTYFDINTCQCQICYGDNAGASVLPCLHSDTKVFCLNFENNGAERGIWYNQDSACNVQGWSHSGAAHSLQVPGGPCTVEVPYFQNNEFREFKLCGWFYALDSSIDQGLVFNGGKPGDDCHPGSIELSLKNGNLFAQIITDQGTFSINGPAFSSYTWYDVCLKYDGKTLELTVNDESGNLVSSDSTAARGVTLRSKCNLMIGANFDSNGIQHFLRGNVDDICFWRAAN